MPTIIHWKIKRLTKKLVALRQNRINSQPPDEVLKQEVLHYFELATLYKQCIGKKQYPFAELTMLECYRAAAALDDATAHFRLGLHALEKGKYRLSLQNGKLFDSPSNAKRLQYAFQEAQAHLQVAEQLGHIEAMRLRGLCFLNGWGVAVDADKGFALIVASIEKEGSWDKVPEIFAALELNNPAFFAEIMRRRQ